MRIIFRQLFAAIAIAAISLGCWADDSSAPNISIEKSKYYSCISNGKEVAVYEFGPGGVENICLANIYKKGKQKIIITVPEEIKTFCILPKSAGIAGKAEGNTLSFTARGRKKLHIQVNDLPFLELTTDEPEKKTSQKAKEATYYYAPGEHFAGTLQLKSGDKVRIDEGAIVHADIRGEGDHIDIRGRGILHGTILLQNCDQLHVSDIAVCNSANLWTNTLICCTHSSYKNVKVFSCGVPVSQDGINPVACKDFCIEDCFIRSVDDCIAIKSFVADKNGDMGTRNIHVSHCVMVGWRCADGVTMGFELNGGEVKDILIEDCDILKADGGGRTGGHSAFSIVCDGAANVHHITYDNLRIGLDIYPKNMELIVTDGKLYGEDEPGQIHDITIRNIQWENASRPFVIQGREGHVIRNVLFENCSIAGKPFRAMEDAPFQTEHTEHIQFKNDK